MQAAFYTRQGLAAQVFTVGEQPTPQPGPGQVRVRVRASGANPSDWKTRKGGGGRQLIAPLIVPHSDGAGDIDAVGEGVPASRIGERVWIWNGQWKRPLGTAAEFIALPSQQAVALPANVSYEEGACMGVPGFTALQAVRLAALQPGETVLVQAGAGAVGHYAIQLARLRGAKVLTTVSSQAKAAHAGAAGADHAIDYRREDIGARVAELTAGRGVDCVIEMDVTNNAAQYPKLLRAHGRVVIYGMTGVEATLPTLWLMQNSIALKFFMIYDIAQADRDAGVRELSALLAEGKLRHTIAMRLPLAEIARAHDLLEGGTLMGNVVLTV
ncbi:MAG: NADPH:quinone oxidoreductase [Ramlibacter sp.]|jgi:NADPH2:quinone reductase|uniref:NADPH:quinone reductase n=1 Tax=Ramlibacter sp. TaxID=1917967 RepID=UPI0026272923|nr:NADPH:quinone reductase [Ramlibacter sp.]MDB5750426.1 NADPH:quinone oxidoreductase [Ramlibacter sp.]